MTFLCSLALAQVAGAEVDPTGRVTAVTVFPDRATVTRQVSASLVAGTNAVVFRDLPPDLDPDTLQAEGAGAPGAVIRGLSVERRELAEDRRARVAALEDRLTALRDQHREASDAKAAAEAELAFLRSLSAAAAAQLSAELMFADGTPSDADALAALVRARTTAALADARAADIARRDVQAEIEAVERELRAVRGAPQWARHDVTVLVDATAEGTATVGLSYIVPGASWTPVWDARGEPGAETVTMSLSAQVVQTTGEDWSDVALVLSTARPAGGVTPPELSPFWLSPPAAAITGAPARKTGGGGAGVMEAAAEDADDGWSGVEAAAEPMAVLVADVREQAVASTFAVPGRSAVPGDGDRRKIAVADVEVPAAWSRVAVPALDERAWIVAENTWTAGWPLLAGPVAIFAGDAYVGSMTLPTVGAGGTFELGFGPDDAVRVDRVVVEELRRGPNLFGKVTVTRLWRTTLANGRQDPVGVSLRDRIPVPTDDRWTVEPLGDAPTVVGDEGRLEWRRELAPGGEAAVTTGWSLRYPRKHPPGGF